VTHLVLKQNAHISAKMHILNHTFRQLIINWFSEKIAEELKYTESTSEILKVAEEKINYYKAQENGK
jgi:hypothetical protein